MSGRGRSSQMSLDVRFYRVRWSNGEFEIQAPMSRLCEALEICGEVRYHERITHLEIAGNLIRFRVEQR
jgi:hypothetical protein